MLGEIDNQLEAIFPAEKNGLSQGLTAQGIIAEDMKELLLHEKGSRSLMRKIGLICENSKGIAQDMICQPQIRPSA